MTTAYLTTGRKMNGDDELRPKLQSCVSIVVDDVDGEEESSGNVTFSADPELEVKDSNDEVFQQEEETAQSTGHLRSSESRGSTSREESETRLQQIKDEVRHRRDEFARLLDEHEQVVRELRRIESSSELQNLAEAANSLENSKEE